MNILLATDNNFVQHCCVTITSVLINNPGTVFYLFTDGLSEYNTKLLTDQVEKYKGELHICKINKEQVKDFPMPPFMSSHISIATYYRLFAAKLLPSSVERILYLDCDIVVTGSLRDLWCTDLDGYALAAVYQSHEHSEGGVDGPKAYTRLSIPPEDGYFNAGVLLLNLNYWREHDITQRLVDFIGRHYDLIHAHDQDVLNAVLHSEAKSLEMTWNFRDCFLDGKCYTYPSKIDYSRNPQNPRIIHYVSKPKPWQYYCRHPFKQLYFDYLSKTPFKGWKPKSSWNEFYEFRLTPFIVKYDKLKIRHLFLRPRKQVK